MSAKTEQSLYFIVGIGGSGTTILNKLLNNHPAIHCLPEANFILFFLHKYKNRRSFTVQDIELIFRQIYVYSLSHPWVGWEFEPEATKQKVLARINSGPLSYAELCKMIFRDFKVVQTNKENAGILIDKNPSYTLYADKLEQVFPDAKFIFLLRDYRANVLSRKQGMFIKGAGVPFNAFRWRLFNKRMQRYAKRHSDRVHIIRYEDLVKNSDPEMLKLFGFLGVEEIIYPDLPAQQTDYEAFDISERYKARFLKKYKDLDKPLNPGRLSSWEQQLSTEEIKICEAFCGDFAKEFMYFPVNKLPGLQKALYYLRYARFVVKAMLDVYKDLLIYYASPELKLKRLEKKYHTLGFFKK